MPIYSLPATEADYLSNALAETGMGFQLVELPLRRWSDATLFLAFNSRYLLPGDDPPSLLRALGEIGAMDIERFDEVEDLVSLADEPMGVRDAYLAASRLDEDVQTTEAASPILNPQPLVSTRTQRSVQAYFRFSAFRNDRRVGRTGEFKPGTYATTYNDLRMVPSGYAAVGRYALPSPLPAKYVFPIITDATPIRIGTTVPNFGQAGGGVEAMFPLGASHLRRQPHTIPAG